MNESLLEFLFNAAIVMFFVVAVTLFFTMNGFSSDIVELVKNDINSRNEVILVVEEKEELLVSGEEILSDILSGSVSQFHLNNLYSVSNPSEFDYYSVLEMDTKYSATPICDNNGNVMYMKYDKVN